GKQRESELKNQQQPRQEKDNDRDSGAQQQPSGENNSNADQQAGNGASQPPPLDHAERETLEVQWQQRMAGAAQQALQAGKMGDSIARMVDHLLQPRLPWRMLLARYMTQVARDDFSYMRPSRREGDAVLPSLRSSQVEIVVAVDTSGSIQSKEIDEFLSEISAIKGQMRARISLFPCDAAIAEDAPFIYEPWEEFEMPENLSGGGGTDFRPVFDWLRNNGTEPALLVYFTDAEGQFPELEAGFPVIWLVKGKAPTPWGQRIQLN
ncbi:MAG: vWA domain-containing protein, partial [bacterium]